MQLSKIEIKTFRLLEDVSLLLEAGTTVVVGRNNCGKTSLTEIVKRLLQEGSPVFSLEDFSFSAHTGFWDAFVLFKGEGSDEDVRGKMPTISARLHFSYGKTGALGPIGEFVVDTNLDCTEAVVAFSYHLKGGRLNE